MFEHGKLTCYAFLDLAPVVKALSTRSAIRRFANVTFATFITIPAHDSLTAPAFTRVFVAVVRFRSLDVTLAFY